MSKALITESTLTAIGGAIREKLGVQTAYKPGEMAAAIGQIHGAPVLETKSITENGTYTPAAGKDGFSEISVNVPNSYAAADEGKVVSNGALVAQTAHATVTQNGTIDTTLNNSVVVNVSGGSGNVYAFARVLYPQGDTVTASDGTTTLTSDTSGEYVFAIPNSGTWIFSDAAIGVQISHTFADYGESWRSLMSEYLPDSSMILAQAVGKNYVSGATVWDDFSVTGTPADATANTESGIVIVNLPLTAKAEHSKPAGDFTLYAVIKNYTNVSFNYIFGTPYAMSSGNGLGFCSSGGKVNATKFQADYNTGISSLIWHVYAISIDQVNKKARMFLDGAFQKEYTYNNIGDIYVTGEGSNESGRRSNADVAYVGVASGCESDATVVSNMQNLMDVFNALGGWNA